MAKWHREYNDDDDNELENQENNQESTEQELTPEEKTWKKRYGDLRAYQQKETSELRSQLEAMKRQLDESTKNNIKLPKTPEEIKEWATAYPDVADIVRTIAIEENSKSLTELTNLRKNIENEKLENDRRSAIAKLDRLHPDFFPTIKDSDEFDAWLQSKSKRTRDALYENDTDADAAAEVITMYKLETGFGKEKKPNNQQQRQAASETRVRDRQEPSTEGEMVFSESQIERMSNAEYEKNEEAITKAMREGKVLMDVTGGAR